MRDVERYSDVKWPIRILPYGYWRGPSHYFGQACDYDLEMFYEEVMGCTKE